MTFLKLGWCLLERQGFHQEVMFSKLDMFSYSHICSKGKGELNVPSCEHI